MAKKKTKKNTVRLTTDYGTIDILLFENIKFHRANFIMLTKKKSILTTLSFTESFPIL